MSSVFPPKFWNENQIFFIIHHSSLTLLKRTRGKGRDWLIGINMSIRCQTRYINSLASNTLECIGQRIQIEKNVEKQFWNTARCVDWLQRFNNNPSKIKWLGFFVHVYTNIYRNMRSVNSSIAGIVNNLQFEFMVVSSEADIWSFVFEKRGEKSFPAFSLHS